MFLYSPITEAGDSFVHWPLHTGTKPVSHLLLLCLPCSTGEYLNFGSNCDVYLAKGLLGFTDFLCLSSLPYLTILLNVKAYISNTGAQLLHTQGVLANTCVGREEGSNPSAVK